MRILTPWLVVVSVVSGCSDTRDEPRPLAAVPVTQGLGITWDLFPHRLSRLEATFESDEVGGVLRGECNGGSFGAIDTPRLHYWLSLWRSRRLAFQEESVELEIAPGASVEGEPFAVSHALSISTETLAGADAMVALIRGIRVSTDEYDEPPPFESDPDLPYAPVDGFTSQGIAVTLGDPTLGPEGLIHLEVMVRNSLGLSDRADMNAAIPLASTWIRADILLIGAFGPGAAATSGETSYFISAADYGANTLHEHASPEEQRIALQGTPGVANALFGLRSVAYWLNIEGRHDPACEVVQDEINSWDEPVSGPGRYVRELSARLHGSDYDRSTGLGQVQADLMLSNSSTYKEVGNLCLGVRAEATMLQFDDAEAQAEPTEITDLRLEPDEPREEEVRFE